MYLSRRTKKLLKAASQSVPSIQGEYYSGVELSRTFHICNDADVPMILQMLKNSGLIQIPYDTCPDFFFLTESGKSYGEFCFHESLDFFKSSILCPVVVTIITEAIIHAAPILLKLLLSKG